MSHHRRGSGRRFGTRAGKKAGCGRALGLLALASLAGWLVPRADGQESAGSGGGVTVEVSVDRSVITIGDHIRYQVRIVAEGEVEVPVARLHPDLGQFEILDFTIAQKPTEENGRRVWVDEYVISTYTTGEYEIPPYRLKYRTGGGEEEASSGPVRIEVQSLTQEESEAMDIEDIKPPVPVEVRREWWIAALVAVGVAGAMFGVLAYLRFGRRRKLKAGPPTLPPHELALLELESLRRSEIVLEEDAEAFSVAVSAIIRTYVEGRFGIPSAERTTEETLHALEEHPEAAAHVEPFAHFFDSCDLVKFGGDLFRWDDFRAVIDEAEQLVRTTAPAPAVPVEEMEGEEGGRAPDESGGTRGGIPKAEGERRPEMGLPGGEGKPA